MNNSNKDIDLSVATLEELTAIIEGKN